MKRRGFTLIELIIVLAIISTSFLILTFKFSVIDNIGAQNEVKTFLNDYSYARDKALSTGKEVEIVFKNDVYEIGEIERKLKYIDCLYSDKMTFKDSGYVSVESTKPGHRVIFTSKKDPEKQWAFKIEAVGGYIYESK